MRVRMLSFRLVQLVWLQLVWDRHPCRDRCRRRECGDAGRGLASVARAGGDWRLDRAIAAGALERYGRRRVEGAASRRRRVVAGGVGRSGVRHVADRRRCSP